jgi:dCTP diphosphatase
MVERSVLGALRNFVAARDWDQFHSSENLAKSIVIEAAEFLECFQWSSQADDEGRVQEELADVLTYCYLLAAKLELDADRIVMDKLWVTETKYPVEKSRGRSAKSDQLPD